MIKKVSSDLIVKIEIKRRELNNLIENNDILDPKVIEKSEELDELIYEYEYQVNQYEKK